MLNVAGGWEAKSHGIEPVKMRAASRLNLFDRPPLMMGRVYRWSGETAFR